MESEIREDIQAVANALAAGTPLDPAIVQRVQERAAQVRERLLRTHGVQNVAVQIIREIRGDWIDP